MPLPTNKHLLPHNSPPKQVTVSPLVKPEFYDGANWFKFATEDFVIDSYTGYKPCIAISDENLSATYDNGTSGVGATLTAAVNSSFTIHAVAIPQGSRVLVAGQTDQKQNGIYLLTTAGDTLTKWVLTRSTDYDSPNKAMIGGVISVVGSNVQTAATLWMEVSLVLSIGTSDIKFEQINGSIESILGTPDQIKVVMSGSTATISFEENPEFKGFEGMVVPQGTNGTRPLSPKAGTFRFNTDMVG